MKRFHNIVLITGSSPDALRTAHWDVSVFSARVAINNAWGIRPDWTHTIFPEDFPKARQPTCGPGQRCVTAADYVPQQNRYGGFVYGGGTMAFTAAYWVLAALRPQTIGFVGCDMVYPPGQPTHFYGTGSPDPLREDITLRNLEAKSARFAALAQRDNCQVINLTSLPESRLVYPKVPYECFLTNNNPPTLAFDHQRVTEALQREAELKYFVASGQYWKSAEQFKIKEIDQLDNLWLSSLGF